MNDLLKALDRATDVVSVLAGCACLTAAGFLTSPRCGLVVLGSCLVSLPLLFSWILPLMVRRKSHRD